ncbi:MAG: aldo/keto reductase [Chloroflexi bacterium]|nr:aldo/keto reductase [Chloroflexota bacterium]
MVTELGMGAMDTPQVPEGGETLRLALESGINFIDTAREYQGSEYLLGEVIGGRGSKDFYVATKTFSRTRDGSQYDVDRSLKVLGVEKIDLYQLHDVSSDKTWEQVMQEGGALEGLQIARIRGLVDYIGISSHSLDVLEKAITCGEFDTVMLEYSAFFPETARLARLAKEKGVGVIAMRPLGGSGRTSAIRTRLASGHESTLPVTMLLRYVLSNPDISVAIPGMRYPSRVRENAALASDYQRLTEAEQRMCEAEGRLLFQG